MQTNSLSYSPEPVFPMKTGDRDVDHPTKPAPDRTPKKKTAAKPAPKPKKKK